jgi:glyoxylase-like metal-dependent hydrolase (beta-lactamase superfamily II)
MIMARKPRIFQAFRLALALSLMAAMASAQDAKTVIQKAQKAMGDAKSVQYSGTGTAGGIGQNWNPTSPWHPTIVTSYTKTIDYVNAASKEELTRTEENPAPKGGEAPFAGEQKQVNFVGGGWAWNAPPPNQAESPNGAATGSIGVPAPAASEERALQIWLTPHGFLRAAAAGKATVGHGKEGGKKVTVVTFMDDKGHRIVGDIDDQNMVTKVDSWLPNPVLGDMLVETTYTDYKDFGGVKFPGHIVQKQGGWPVLDLTVTSAKANIPDASIQVASNAIGETLPAVNVVAQKMADGVWFLGGGTHNSVLIEFKDYVVVAEAPLNDARSQGVMDEVKMLVPNKPIKYVFNTHHHFDHSGGLRAYVAAGATIITNEGNKEFYETAWKAPRTLQPDMLSQNPKPATFITFKDKYVLTDGSRSLEIYKLQGDNHNEFMSIGYLPKENILIEADDFTPPAPNGPALVPIAMGLANNLNDNLQRLKLQVNMIAPLHGNPAPMSTMLKILGKSQTTANALSCN